jgi:amicyanin
MKNVLIALGVLVVVGFGTYFYVFNGHDDSSEYGFDSTQNTEPISTAPENTGSSSEVSKNEEVTINIKNFSFNPPVVNVKVGTKVNWINNDSVRHSVISSGSKLFESPLLSQGESFSFVFTDVGTADYHCGPHPSMKGKIVVTN